MTAERAEQPDKAGQPNEVGQPAEQPDEVGQPAEQPDKAGRTGARMPGTVRLYARAVRGLARRGATVRRRADGGLPATAARRDGVPVDPDHLSAYLEVCGFPRTDRIPASYPHVLAFPLSMYLMSDRAFPLPLPGAVHLANRLELLRPMSATDRLDFSVHTADLRPHRRGLQFDVVATASVAGELAWRGVSTYLHRVHSGPDAKQGVPDAGIVAEHGLPHGGIVAEHGLPHGGIVAEHGLPHGGIVAEHGLPAAPGRSSPAELSVMWTIGPDAGRRYGRVSGDRNPIHVSRLAARAFGFPGPIAHGMFTAARCLAALGDRLPERYVAEMAFRAPVPLAAKVRFRAIPTPSTPVRRSSTSDGTATSTGPEPATGVHSRDWSLLLTDGAGRTHLTGTVRPV